MNGKTMKLNLAHEKWVSFFSLTFFIFYLIFIQDWGTTREIKKEAWDMRKMEKKWLFKKKILERHSDI